jgi:hypothetical protein
MTIGIGATGAYAGLAVFRALEAAERVGTGAIRGFAVFAAIDANGDLRIAQTQRGGTTTLFTDGEATGVLPPQDIAEARFAVVMSSGPDRPEPLMQFIAADPQTGLVTGHRLPNTLGPDGVAVNTAVLTCMARGMSAHAALDAVLEASPDVDAGMIALGANAGIAARNSALVDRRPDLGAARREGKDGTTVVEVLHNAIHPHATLAPLVADIALAIMSPAQPVTGEISVAAGTPVVHGDRNRVFVDARGCAVRIETENASLTSGRHNCAAIYLGSEIVRDGAVIGTTLFEPNVMVQDGTIETLSGQAEVRITFTAEAAETQDQS